MEAYVFQAAFLCEDCGKATCDQLRASVKDLYPEFDESDEHTFDSDYFPKGPYSEGGGEADCPQHCDHCGVFLENPLTQDGYAYLAEQLSEHIPAYESMDWREAVEALRKVESNARDMIAIKLPGDTVNWEYIAHSSKVVREWVAYYEPWNWATG